MQRITVLAGLCWLGLTTAASARTWDCDVWQWDGAAKRSIGSFAIDPGRLTTERVVIDADTTASCTGEMDRSATQALLVCTVYTASTHYAARAKTADDGSYLMVSGNRTDLLVDDQIECSPHTAK